MLKFEIETAETHLPDCALLCVYRPTEPFYLKLAIWLDEDESRHLIVFNGQEFHPRAIALDPGEEAFKALAWQFVFTPVHFAVDPEHGEQLQQVSKQLFAQFQFIVKGVHLLASDYSDFGAKALQNLFYNLEKLPKSKNGSELFGKFQGVPAIICGAGSSLKEQQDLLKKMSSQALIFGGGSSLPLLSAMGIAPHFAACIDPDPDLNRFLEQTAFEAPFFYQQRVSHRILDHVHAPLLRISDSGLHPLENHLAEILGLPCTPYDAGWNVVTFMTALAVDLGCSPIIYAGVDLAKQADASTAQVRDHEDKPHHSQPDWVIAADWIENFVSRHPEIRWFSLGAKGMALKGVAALPDPPLDGVQRDLCAMVHAQVEQIPAFSIQAEQIADAKRTVSESSEHCLQTIDRFINYLQQTFPSWKGAEGQAALAEIELEEELFYQKVLAVAWVVWKPVLERQHHALCGMEKKLYDFLFLKNAIAQIGWKHV